MLSTTIESPALTPTVSRDVAAYHDATFSDNTPLPPNSSFYTHPSASYERIAPAAVEPALATSEKDLECGNATPYTMADDENPFSKKFQVGSSSQECTMWPTRQTLRQTRLEDKKQRRAARTCGCGTIKHHWAGYTKNQRWALRILIALVVIGAIVGVAVGITHSVNGGVWSDKGTHDLNHGKGGGA